MIFERRIGSELEKSLYELTVLSGHLVFKQIYFIYLGNCI